MTDIPHAPWFLCPTPTQDGQAIIENGTDEGSHIAVCEWHIAEFIIKTVNEAAKLAEIAADSRYSSELIGIRIRNGAPSR